MQFLSLSLVESTASIPTSEKTKENLLENGAEMRRNDVDNHRKKQSRANHSVPTHTEISILTLQNGGQLWKRDVYLCIHQ